MKKKFLKPLTLQKSIISKLSNSLSLRIKGGCSGGAVKTGPTKSCVACLTTAAAGCGTHTCM